MGRSYNTQLEVQHLPAYQLKVESNELLPDFTSPAPVTETLLNEALKARLDLKVISQALAVNETSLRNIKANTIPNIQLNAGYSYSGNPPVGLTNQATQGYFLGITQEVPLFNFSKETGPKTRQSQSVEATTGIRRKNIVTEEVISAYQQMMAAREHIGYFHESILATSATVAKMARRGYEMGQTDITTTLAAQQANFQTQIAYLDAVRSYQLSMTALEQAVGEPL